MADVQLEHGYLKVANRLMEAIIEARLGERKLQVMLVLMRLTYGWRRSSVQLTEFELAGYCGAITGDSKRAGGSFRADLAELVRERIIVRVEASGKRGLMTWAINKDYSTWGRHAISPTRLASKWNTKPKATRTDDEIVRDEVARNQATHASGARTNDWPESGPDNGDEWPGYGPHNEGEWTGTGPECGPVTGPVRASKSLFGETYDAGKTMKDSSTPLVQKDHQTVASVVSAPKAFAADDFERAKSVNDAAETQANTPTRQVGDVRENGGNLGIKDPESLRHTTTRPRESGGDPVREYAISLSTAANAAIARRWGEQPNPIRYTTGLELAAELIREHVPIELARHVIGSVCQASKAEQPPMRVIGYFRGAIMDGFRDAEQRALNAADAGAARGGPPRPIAAVVNADHEREKQALQDRYDAERRTVAVAWGKDPANAAAYATIVDGVNASYANLPDSPFKERGRAVLVLSKCAEAAGFPDFVTWCTAGASA